MNFEPTLKLHFNLSCSFQNRTSPLATKDTSTTSPQHQFATGDNGGGLVVDAALEAGGAPVHKLDGALGLDGGHSSVDILGDWKGIIASEASVDAIPISLDQPFIHIGI